MELWLLLGGLAYLSYSLCNSVDKYLMNLSYDKIKTFTFRNFFNALILIVIGLLFFKLSFTWNLFFWSLLLGFIFACAGSIFYYCLKKKDAQVYVPYTQSAELLLIFVAAVIFLGEVVSTFNIGGIALILSGIYIILLKKGAKFPKIDYILFFMLIAAGLVAVYSLLVKILVSEVSPISLAIMVYFSAFLFTFVFQLLFRRKVLFGSNMKLYKVAVSSFLGAMGTLLLFTALTMGNASKVYPLAGLQSVFVFFIALIFLKERFYWYKLAGTVLVLFGIYFVSL